jgi:hypothetical protein
MLGERVSKPKSKRASQRTKHAESATRVKVARRVRRSGAPRPFERLAYHAQLSLECYAYTNDPYWLDCAFADCRKAKLDWDALCMEVLGRTVAPPKR